MVLNMKEILDDMGWSDGYYIPVANNENLQLEAEIEKLTAIKLKLTFNHDALSQKCLALDKHMKNVTKEQQENQDLLFARQSQLSAEKNLHILAKKEKDHLNSDIRTINKEYEKVEERKQHKHKELNTMIEKLDKLKMSIEWDEETIENWEDMLLKKYEDNDIIKKFSHEDKKKAKDLEIKRQRLQEEEHSRKQLVIRTSKELDGLELILTRNIQMFKQMHEERNSLLKQWQDAVKHLQQRDQETLAISREIINVQELNEAKLEVLEQEKEFYKNEINNNKELQIQIEANNQEITRLRKDLGDCANLIRTYNMEMEAMKRELQKSSDLLQKERIAVKKLHNERIQKEGQLEKMLLKVQQLKKQEKEVEGSNATSGERLKTLEELIQSEEAIEKGLFCDIENLQNTIFRSQQVLNNLLEFNKIKTTELQGTEQGILLLGREKEQLDKHLLAQKEEHYKINYRIALLKSKLTRISGTQTDENEAEVEANEKKFQELEEKCNEVLKLSNMLQIEQIRLEDVMRQLTNSIAVDAEKLDRMKNKMQNQVLLVEGAVKSVIENRNLDQQNQVDENVLKVRLNHAEKAVKQEGNYIFNLQRQQLELETMMKERETEIHINKDMLIAKRNGLNEDNSKMRVDIQGCRLKREILKKRLDTILSSIGKTEDGENVSVAYFKVKNAQEKYMLQEEGDRLDGLVRKAEKEIIAMENTLKAVNICNDSFRKTLTVIEEQDQEMEEMKQVETELYAASKLLRKSRNELEGQKSKLQEIHAILQKKKEEIDELEIAVADKENDLSQLQNEAKHRTDKIQRADKQIKKLIITKDLDDTRKHDFLTHQLQDFNKSALQQLTETSVRYHETKPTINNYLAERNLSLSVSSLRTSTRSCSSNSYTSSSSNHYIPKIKMQMDESK